MSNVSHRGFRWMLSRYAFVVFLSRFFYVVWLALHSPVQQHRCELTLWVFRGTSRVFSSCKQRCSAAMPPLLNAPEAFYLVLLFRLFFFCIVSYGCCRVSMTDILIFALFSPLCSDARTKYVNFDYSSAPQIFVSCNSTRAPFFRSPFITQHSNGLPFFPYLTS